MARIPRPFRAAEGRHRNMRARLRNPLHSRAQLFALQHALAIARPAPPHRRDPRQPHRPHRRSRARRLARRGRRTQDQPGWRQRQARPNRPALPDPGHRQPRHARSPGRRLPQGALMKPATVTDSLLHDLVVSALAEGTDRLAVAAAVTLDDRILFCGRDTGDFDQQWGLPGGAVLPGETLTSALDRILACDYGLDTTEIRAYLGSYDRIHHGEMAIRTFVFTASCADPLQICRHARIAHCWADPASLPEQDSQELARLTDLAMQATAPSGPPTGRWE